jgi:hypothetical protein
MENKLFIPGKIKVGFNYRENTYSKKLAFITYCDSKGKLRKQGSWEGWIQHPGKQVWDPSSHKQVIVPEGYEPIELENKPMSGFILNRNVGGVRQSYGYNARVEKVRVYDPRGFEMEIDIPNLLFILQECTSTKGKGLEGEFVYSWNGKDIVLLPLHSLEYKESTEHTKLQSKKVTSKDMTEGCHYTFKSGEKTIYLGRYETYNTNNRRYGLFINLDYIKMHIFLNLDNNEYIFQKGFTKLATKDTETPDPNYAEYLQTFLDSRYHSKLKNINLNSEKVTEIKKEFCETYDGLKTLCTGYYISARYNNELKYTFNNKVYRVGFIYLKNEDKYIIALDNYTSYNGYNRIGDFIILSKNLNPKNIYENRNTFYSAIGSQRFNISDFKDDLFTLDEITDLDIFGKVYVNLESNKKLLIENYCE